MKENRLMEDALARRVARTEFTRPVILRAGAGTGKTAALVARIVSWTVGPGWRKAKATLREDSGPERVAGRTLSGVVAITFTEAAAAEMAERVATALHAVSTGCSVIGLPAEELPTEGRVRAQHLLGAIELLEIRTIHAWCRSLLAQYPLEAGLHPAFTVDADGSVTRRTIRETVEDGLATLLDSEGDAAFLKLLGLGISPADIEASVASLIGQGVELSDISENPFNNDSLDGFCATLGESLSLVLDVLAGTLDGVRAPNAQKLINGLQGLSGAAVGCESFGTLANTAAEHVPPNLRKHMNKAWVRGEGGQAESGALQPIADRLAGPAQELVLLLEELEGLDPEGYLSAVDVLVPLAKEANARLHSAGVLGFDALLKGAQRLLMRPGVSARVRHRLDQLLVDEFQDTDSVQCSLIRSLTMQGPKEEHPGLFIVGDPKQSIYGWRSADLEAYEDFVAELTRHGALHHSLVQNFRSVGGILSEVDRCMTHMMISKPGVQPEYEGLIAARGPGPSGPSVEAWVSWEWEDGEAVVPTPAVAARQVEAKALAGDLFRLQEEGTSLGSIGVLFRSMTHIDVYQRALRDHGISYEVTRDRQYFRRSEIVEAAAMVRCLLDPLDSIALVTFLRSSMVQLPDAALMPLWGERFPKVWMELGVGSDAVARANQCIEQVFPMVSQLESDIPGLGSVGEWRTHLRNVVASVDRLRRSVKSEGFDLWVQDARRTFYTDVLGGVAYQGAYRVANLEQFFRQIVRDAKDNRGDLRSLSRSLREAVGQQQEAEEARPSQSGNAVQLMTIHKAKGLAFEHTYMVDLHHRIRGSERPRGTVCDPSFGIQLLGMWPPGFRYHWAKAERVAGAERVRLLYVAMTRARDRLVWMGAWPAELREGPRPRMLLDLFSARNPPLSNPMDLVGELSGSAEVVRGDIRWVFPGRMESSAPQAKSGEASLNQEFTVIAQGASEDALRLSQRPWTQGPSSATETTAGIGGKLSRTDALLVGTAIHWMLERLPKTEKITSELSREQLERALLLAADGGAISKAARERALVLLERVQLGGLIHHFENVEVLGQEVPLLLAPEDVGPIGAWVGSIDLLYRGPDGLYVVADYKTEQSGDRSSLEIGGHHAAQGRLYVEAVKKSLKLNYAPKFEIWLLERDERIIVDVD